MKTLGRISWMNLVMAVLVLFLVSCGNSQKKQDNTQQSTMQNQQADSTGIIVEETEVIVVTDSISPDSTAKPAQPAK